MNVTRDVILDLWPLYSAGEASADTKELVDSFFQADPEWARTLNDRGPDLPLPPEEQMIHPDKELQAFSRTKRILYGRNWFLFFAMMFSCLAFGRIVSDTSWDVSPRQFIITAVIAGCFWIAFITRLVMTQRAILRPPLKGRSPSS